MGIAALVLCVPAPALARDTPPASVAGRQIDALALRYKRFVLPNGLRVVVHTDRKAPVVAVNVSYAVGAKDEAPDRAGFAHLFEHLMLHPTPYSPRGWMEAVGALGASQVNGNTTHDGTHFYQTVPTGALDRVLFLEADRMRHLGDRIDQAALDINRAIVQNEKRQTDNAPMGTVADQVAARLLPPDHPFGHTVLGTMASLDAASVADVRDWQRRHYGPNNAVLVVSGDIDAATARRLATRHFGDIGRRAAPPRPAVPIITLPAPITGTSTDRVTAVTVTRHWIVPGLDRPDGLAIDMTAKVIGSLSGAWLDEMLLRRERLVSSIMASSGTSADLGTFIISYTVAAGVDPARVATRLDAVLAGFLRDGPSAQDIRRVAMREIGWQTQSLEPTGGQAATLSDGELGHGDPLHFRRHLRAMAALDPATVRAAARRWLARPAYTLTIVPGAVPAYREAAPRPVVAPSSPPPGPVAPLPPLPPIGPTVDLAFPRIERARLANGIEMVLARRPDTPVTRIALELDAGAAADPAGRPGMRDLLLALLTEGAGTHDARALSIAREELGADWFFQATADHTTGTLTMPSASLDPALGLFADMVRRPTLAADAVAGRRVAAVDLARQQAIMPDRIAGRVMAGLLHGASSPYARAAANDPATIAAVTRNDLAALHRRWFRPDKVRLFIVSDLPMARLRAALERCFGDWTSIGPAGGAAFPPSVPAGPRIVLVNRPDSPQSLIVAAIPTTLGPRDDLLALDVANEVLGGSSGRINTELRERRGWSYGAHGSVVQLDHATSYTISAPVQADRTGAALIAIRDMLAGVAGSQSITAEEAARARSLAIAGLPGRYERGDAVLAAIRGNAARGRPDDYQSRLPERYRSLDRADLTDAITHALAVDRTLWVVVGDARTVQPQFNALALPVETID